MFTHGEFERINTDFKQKLQERNKKLKKIWGMLLAVSITIILLFIALFPNQFDDGGTAWILPTYGGLALAATLTGFLVSTGYTSEKPFFEDLFPDIIQKINSNEGLFLEYTAYEKQDKTFNQTGGLFTSFASVKIRRRIEGNTEEQHHFKIYDCTMTTSNGKSQTTHFDGVYFVLQKQLNTVVQIRSNGSPKLKGVKFDKQDDITDVKVYKERDKTMMNIDHQLVNYASRLFSDEQYKRGYLGVVDNEVHLALWYRKHPARKQKNVNLDTLNNYLNYFQSELQLVNELAAIDNY